jgi:hypothetical protein
MRPESPTDGLVTPVLLAEVQAMAHEEQREPRKLVREAVTRYLEQRRIRPGAQPKPKHTPADASARILELREGNVLPSGVTIKDLINFGRA